LVSPLLEISSYLSENCNFLLWTFSTDDAADRECLWSHTGATQAKLLLFAR